MPGDVINAEVYGKYVDQNSSNWNGALTTLMGQIAANQAGVVYDGANYSSSTSSFPFAGLINTTGSTGGPKAYLNWLIFDRNYTFLNGGYVRMSATPKEQGQDVAHELMSSGNITITEPGYVYIYLSNEETSPVEVYFDDMKVTQTNSPVVQVEDYYPFGLTFNEYQRENGIANLFQYNSKEMQDELNLGWLDYGARMYMAEIGRFQGSDPHSENYRSSSPIVYSLNNPILLKDSDGKDIIITNLNLEQQKALAQFAKTNEGRKFLTQFAVKDKEYNIGGEKFRFSTKQSSKHDIIYETGNPGGNDRAVTKTEVYDPVKRRWIDVYSSGSYSQETIGNTAQDPKYQFTVTVREGISDAAFTLGHESLLHADVNKSELDQAYRDFNSGNNAKVDSPLKNVKPEEILRETLQKISNGPTDHKLLVNGKAVKFETFVRELDKLQGGNKNAELLKKEKKKYKDNPGL